MSGQQIGTAVGFVAGFFLPGGPQVWAAVGGLIGGAIDPTKIEGPHIGDGRQQSSNEGESIAWIMGTAGWVQGNIVQVSTVREVKQEDDGKGGPVTVTYQARQDFCIMAAESCELRDSTIVGVLIVRQNGQIVYDMRPESNFGAENAKFLEHHVFNYGAEDQMPNPTMEAITGVGNTPAYRGVFTMVGFDVDLTPFGNAIPTYEFVLVGEGEVIETTTTTLAAATYGRFVNSVWPLADSDEFYTYSGVRETKSGGTVTYSADTIQEVLANLSLDYPGVPNIYLGYSASSGTGIGGGAPAGLQISNIDTPVDVTLNTSLLLVYNNETPAVLINADPDQTDLCAFIPPSAGPGNWYQDNVGNLVGSFPDESDPDYKTFAGCPFDDNKRGIPPVYIQVKRRRPPVTASTGDPCLLGVPVVLPGVPGFQVDCDGNVSPIPEYTLDTLNGYKGLQQEATEIVLIGGQANTVYSKLTLGPVLETTDPAGTEAFWTAAYGAAVDRGDMAPGLIYGVDYPVTVSNIYVGVSTTSSLESQSLSVATAIERICMRSDLLQTDIDTSEIDDDLIGYPIQADYNGADCIRPLLAYIAGFGAEYDGKIHFHAYGGPIEITVDPQDFIEGSEETDTDTREQAKEFPRKVSLSYIDTTQNYTVRPQYAYRNSPDVRAIGEETVQIPLCATPDRASRLADISMKVSWARQQGSRKFSVPWVGFDTYLKMVAGIPFALDGKRWVANRIMIEDGMMQIEAAYDRQSAYTSIATGVPAPPPTPPKSTIGGVTVSAVMNIPALRDQDDRLGIYVSVAGLLSGWPGCDLQISADGGATWETKIHGMTQASTIGYLLASLPDASEAGDDVTNTLRVSVHGGELNSITQDQFNNEFNPCAIVLDDGTAELIQFRDADETSPGKYDLTHLARGRLGTITYEHPAGRRFVSLDSVYFVELPAAYLGKTILVRPVTLGTAPDSNAATSLVFSPAFSQTELAPEFLTHSVLIDTLSLSVMPRYRFGTDVNPIPSLNMTGFLWDISDGSNSAQQTTLEPQVSFDIAGWASPISVSVRQINRITGPGLALEAEI